ncbi:hypothetical protein BUALT_Bualt13G0041000 [Buddleja alternifolia]|uniref:C3H1-type domain-containing protein n=1 Tax=Buddleja alternifolia TaxID=168488 RepID=A0AAV6WJT1_9LAMI|nr:hypothetical protein BUALT_Bualt13G0041000 [Buddleja alternifolia]
MDTHEATNTVMSRIKNFDPENASKIMGYILIQDPGEEGMARLACGPDALLLSYINQGKAYAERLSNIHSPFTGITTTSPRTSMRSNNNGFHSYDAVLNGGSGGGGCSGGAGSDAVFEGRFREQKPCVFFPKGTCKNGSNCKYSHADIDGGGGEAMEMALQERRFALMAAAGDHDFINFLNENQGYDFSPMGLSDGEDPSSRQIYLTFASDSTFNEEDVSAYFSTFGPVQDVRIPYQQKRMFGKQLMDRGEYPGTDSRELFNNPIGPRLILKKQKMMLRRKMEQEMVLHQTLELQRQRMMNLQLMGLRNEHHSHHFLPFQPASVAISSPRQHQFLMIQNVSSDATNQEYLQDGEKASNSPAVAADNHIDIGNKQWNLSGDDSDLPESCLEHVLLPDDLFASPKKGSGERQSVFTHAEADDSVSTTTNTSVPSSNSPLGMVSPCYFQMTRKSE